MAIQQLLGLVKGRYPSLSHNNGGLKPTIMGIIVGLNRGMIIPPIHSV